MRLLIDVSVGLQMKPRQKAVKVMRRKLSLTASLRRSSSSARRLTGRTD